MSGHKKTKYKHCDGMKGMIKVFDEELYNRYDKKARDFVKNKLTDMIIDNPNKYGEDMIVINKMIPFNFIELQVYGKWRDIFPYENPFIYERKMRYSKNTLFICFNNDLTKMIMFSRDAIHPNKCSADKYEYVHYIPWNRVFQMDANKLSLNTIRECFCLESII